MIGNFVKGKVYVFIDAANLFYAQKTLGWRVGYVKLKEYFERECDARGFYVYTATDELREEQGKFLRMLRHNEFIVRTKPVKQIRVAEGVYQWKGDFDVELTMDMLDMLEKYDSAVLVSGDSDFAPIIDRAKQHGKNVVVMSVKGHISRELLERAKYINLKKLKSEIELK